MKSKVLFFVLGLSIPTFALFIALISSKILKLFL